MKNSETSVIESIQQNYLKYLSIAIFNGYKSESEKLCFSLRYDPKHQNLEHKYIAEIMNNKENLNGSFSEDNINSTVSRVAQKIINKFKNIMINDGIDVDLIVNNKPVRPESDESPYRVTYRWIWEQNFIRDGWSFLKEKSIYSQEGIQMSLPRTRRPANNGSVNLIKKNESYNMKINFQRDGYLLLIDESDNEDKYLLLPSLFFNKYKFSQDIQIYSETTMTLEPAINFNGNSEYFLAIITEKELDLASIKDDLHSKHFVELNKEHIENILKEIGKQGNSIALMKKYDLEN
ncbi:hypothetical protein [Nodularia sp. NIES-3585]|uniref:hypothetical protein n=1 Tax=Nodularia sp. NIES-3585 TaxID=1973477 RepID=UPI000B5C5E81|nr:hypothetical protein [Nodularia sp. NIES-3585]GAX36539.1 hypothetical protein NIES3585_25730 [Nodularia sp. NIES-3585]